MTQLKKTVTVKTTGHEKTRVSVCLKQKQMVQNCHLSFFFKCAKREIAALDKEIKSCCIASSLNAWMNIELTHTWVNKFLGTFSFRRRYLLWDSYECHIEDTVKSSLHAKKIDVSIVLGGCNKYMQTSDVSWDKPSKALATEKYDQWLAEEGINQLNSAGNLKPPPRHTIVNWILKAWEETSPKTIKKSFKSCALNLETNKSKENLIYCFKEGEPYKASCQS